MFLEEEDRYYYKHLDNADGQLDVAAPSDFYELLGLEVRPRNSEMPPPPLAVSSLNPGAARLGPGVVPSALHMPLLGGWSMSGCVS